MEQNFNSKQHPLIRPLLPAYFNCRKEDLKSLKEALNLLNYESISEIGHKLKGSGGTFGFQDLSDIGDKIETAGNQKNKNLAVEYIDLLSEFLTSTSI
ncbi:Hpt domain-containing protein [bacterium]|jgi:HPt (histidine-containing phosphotransfer) domain-containing protein|nr:Hpt domain-containing protein [bacterium]